MNEIEYENACASQAMGEHMQACMDAIMEDCEAKTLVGLQRCAYKYTDAGISVSFQLIDGTYVWPGDEHAKDPALVKLVCAIGFSSIIEDSDAEVPLQWMSLDEVESPEAAVSEYYRRMDETDTEACALWDEVHGDQS